MTRISPAFPTVAGALALTFLWVVAWYWPTTQEITGVWRHSETSGATLLPDRDDQPSSRTHNMQSNG